MIADRGKRFAEKASLCLPNRLDDVADLRGGSVHQNADTVDLGGKNADPEGGGNQNSDGKGNLIPRNRAHGNSRKHRHGRGEGKIRADPHQKVVNVSAGHREHHHHKAE